MLRMQAEAASADGAAKADGSPRAAAGAAAAAAAAEEEEEEDYETAMKKLAAKSEL